MVPTTMYLALLLTSYSRLADDMIKGLPENYAPLLIENIQKGGYTHVFAAHSAFGKNLMPRVAALLDTQQVSDITAIENEDSKLSPCVIFFSHNLQV